VLALIVGTGLATVVFVGVPLQLVGHNKWPWNSVVEIVGTAHGFCYIAYLLCCLDLAGRARFKTTQLLGMVCSGLVPLLAFYMERKVTVRVKAQLAMGADAPPGPAATIWTALVARPGRSRPARQGSGPATPKVASGPKMAAGSDLPAAGARADDLGAPAI
jgi:integral membrane protein